MKGKWRRNIKDPSFKFPSLVFSPVLQCNSGDLYSPTRPLEHNVMYLLFKLYRTLNHCGWVEKQLLYFVTLPHPFLDRIAVAAARRGTSLVDCNGSSAYKMNEKRKHCVDKLPEALRRIIIVIKYANVWYHHRCWRESIPARPAVNKNSWDFTSASRCHSTKNFLSQ